MVNYTLSAKPPLNGYVDKRKGYTVRETKGITTLSLGAFKNSETKLNTALKNKFGTGLPAPGKSSSAGDITILSIARDQWFIRFSDSSCDLPKKITELAAITDQSDSWVELEVFGPKGRDNLERICPIDLHPHAFAIGDVARTSMEHMGAIITRLPDTPEGDSSYLILSPRSSAKSFLHALS